MKNVPNVGEGEPIKGKYSVHEVNRQSCSKNGGYDKPALRIHIAEHKGKIA
jgi:hypothetical protein